MKRSTALSVLCLTGAALTVTSCVTREQADQRLSNACISAAEAFIEEGYKVEDVKDSIFRDHPDLGNGYREVRLFVTEGDGWYSTDKEYLCVFSEELGIFNSSHDAAIYKLKLDNITLGQEGNKLIGTVKQHTKLGNAVSEGLNK